MAASDGLAEDLRRKVHTQRRQEEVERLRKIQEQADMERRRKEEEIRLKKEEEDNKRK